MIASRLFPAYKYLLLHLLDDSSIQHASTSILPIPHRSTEMRDESLSR